MSSPFFTYSIDFMPPQPQAGLVYNTFIHLRQDLLFRLSGFNGAYSHTFPVNLKTK